MTNARSRGTTVRAIPSLACASRRDEVEERRVSLACTACPFERPAPYRNIGREQHTLRV